MTVIDSFCIIVAFVLCVFAIDPCQRQPFYSMCHSWPDGAGKPYRSQVVIRYYREGEDCVTYPYGLCKNDAAAAKLFRYDHQCEKACAKGTNSTVQLPAPISFIAEMASIRIEPREEISASAGGSANQTKSQASNVIKQGICPFPEVGEYAVCVRECHLDYECPRTLKCCYNGCGRLCLDPKPIEGNLCEHPRDHGGCYGYFRRWWYDSGTNACQQFIYGGCGGTGNNFISESDCLQKCHQGTDSTPSPFNFETTLSTTGFATFTNISDQNTTAGASPTARDIIINVPNATIRIPNWNNISILWPFTSTSTQATVSITRKSRLDQSPTKPTEITNLQHITQSTVESPSRPWWEPTTVTTAEAQSETTLRASTAEIDLLNTSTSETANSSVTPYGSGQSVITATTATAPLEHATTENYTTTFELTTFETEATTTTSEHTTFENGTANSVLIVTSVNETFLTTVDPKFPPENKTESTTNQTSSAGSILPEWIYHGVLPNETTISQPKPFPVYGGGPGYSPVLGTFVPSSVFIPPPSLEDTFLIPPDFVLISNSTLPENFQAFSNNFTKNSSESENETDVTTSGPPAEFTATTPERRGTGFVVHEIHGVVEPQTFPDLITSVTPFLTLESDNTNGPRPSTSSTLAPPLPPANSSILCPHNVSPKQSADGSYLTCLPSQFDLSCPKDSMCFFSGMNFHCCPDLELVYNVQAQEDDVKKIKNEENGATKDLDRGASLQDIGKSHDTSSDAKRKEDKHQTGNENVVNRKRFF